MKSSEDCWISTELKSEYFHKMERLQIARGMKWTKIPGSDLMASQGLVICPSTQCQDWNLDCLPLWKLNKILKNFFSFFNENFWLGDCAKWKDMFQTKTGRKSKRSIWRRNTQWKNVKLRLGPRLWGLAALQFGSCCNFETRLDQIQAARSESRTTKVYFVNF